MIDGKNQSEVLSIARAELANMGFKKRTGEIFTLTLSVDVLGWVGLNRKILPGGILEVNPVIGVRIQAVERLIADLCGSPYHDYAPPSISGHIGYLDIGRYSPIFISSVAESQEKFHDLVLRIRTVGLDFMKECSTYAGLAEMLAKSRFAILELARYRIPAALLLAGDLAGARSYVDERLREQSGRSDPAAKQYERFAAALIERERPPG